MTVALQDLLQQGLADLALPLSSAQQADLLGYLARLAKWNTVYNLTSVREPLGMLTQHLMDCLAVLPAILNKCPAPCRVLDVGSGGGLPAVVFAIACPDWRVTAVDTVAKKAAFVQSVSHALNLNNLHAVHGRVENITDTHDLVTCRAFAALDDFVQWSAGALNPTGRWLAMKGKHPQAEIDRLPANVEVESVEPIAVPGLGAERCLVWLRPKIALGGPTQAVTL